MCFQKWAFLHFHLASKLVKRGMKFKTSNAHNFLIDYPIFTNKDSKCSTQ